MKIKLLSIILFFVSFSAFAGVPQAISYQAVARNALGEVVTNKRVSIRVNLLQGSVSGATVYAETQEPVTNQFGVITLQIGMGNALIGSFAGINWANGPYFVKMEMDINGGDQYKEVGISQLLAVPYALYAESTGENVENNNYVVSADHGVTEDILYNGELTVDDDSQFGSGDNIAANVIYLNSKDQEVDCNLTGLPESITFKKTVSKSTAYGRSFDFELTSEIDRSADVSYNCKLVFANKAGVTKEFPFVFKVKKGSASENPYLHYSLQELFELCQDRYMAFVEYGFEVNFIYMKVKTPVDSQWQQLADKTMTPDNIHVENLWKLGFETIDAMNGFIDKASKEAQSTELNEMLIGIKALRAYCLLQLVGWYDHIPLTLEAGNTNVPQSDRSDVLHFLIREFSEVQSVLPAEFSSDEEDGISISFMRYCQIQAYAMSGKWMEMYNMATEHINFSSGYISDEFHFFRGLGLAKLGQMNSAAASLNVIYMRQGMQAKYNAQPSFTPESLFQDYRTADKEFASSENWVLQALGYATEFFGVPVQKTILPIPMSVVNSNPSIVQNPGY